MMMQAATETDRLKNYRRLSTFLKAASIILLLISFVGIDHAIGRDKVLSRIGFGSCAFQADPQPVWDAVRKAKPNVFLLIGDNIYGDTEDMTVLRRKYDQLAAVPAFARLRKDIPFLGTWDDHDYGRNDAGVEFPVKKESQQAFLDFFRVPKDSPRRTQEGVYNAASYGPAGKRVQIILLDTRYFRSSFKGQKPYGPNNDPDATILGEAQWRWLEAQLRQPANLRVIASSIQVVSEFHGAEKWMNFPGERKRLYNLLRETKATGVIFLSGDRHFADLSMMDGGLGYPIYDLTSSGLTQGYDKWRPLQDNPQRVAGMSFDDNFGLIDIDWNVTDPIVSLQIRDVAGDIRINQKLRLSMLQPGTIK